MADLTQSEDYKVLQAMRTEITGLVESKNTLDLEIKKLEEDKVQAELEAGAVRSKLDDVSGEWSHKMRGLINRENDVKQREISLITNQNQFEAKKKEREDGLIYLEAQAKQKEEVIQQRDNESAKKEILSKAEEQKLGAERAEMNDKIAEVEAKREVLVQLEANLDSHSRQIDEAKKTLSKEEVGLRHEVVRLQELEGRISKESTESQEKISKKEENLRQREAMMTDRERSLEKEKATMDTRITKSEADRVIKLQAETESKRQQLDRDRSILEIDVKNSTQELYNLREDVKKTREELESYQGRIADIERREKGVADTEAGLVGKEQQLMFEIAKFKKRVKDAKMEETINESG